MFASLSSNLEVEMVPVVLSIVNGLGVDGGKMVTTLYVTTPLLPNECKNNDY